MSKRMQIASVTIAAALIAGATAYAQDSSRTAFRVASDAGCMICHDVELPDRDAQDFIPKAPEFQAIACRYRSDPNAASRLTSIVRDGSGPLRRDRHWTGQVAFQTMYPNDLMVSEAEARQIVDWMMTLCSKAASSGDRKEKRR
jgi:cytochrome c551/c552